MAPEVEGIVWDMSGIPKGLPFMWGAQQNHTGREDCICAHVQCPSFAQPSHRGLRFTIAHGGGVPVNHSMLVSPFSHFIFEGVTDTCETSGRVLDVDKGKKA